MKRFIVILLLLLSISVNGQIKLGPASPSTISWGSIIGNIDDQTDLDKFLLKLNPIFTGQMQAPYGSLSAPSYTFSLDTTIGMFMPSTETIGFAIAGARIVTLTPGGVGLVDGSITAPAYYFRLDGNLGLMRLGSDSLGIVAGDSLIVTICKAGIFWNGSSPANVGGSDTQVQFNDGGTAFGGDAGFTYNKTTNLLSMPDGSISMVASGDNSNYIDLYNSSISGTEKSRIKFWVFSAPTYYEAGKIYTNGNGETNLYIDGANSVVIQRGGYTKLTIGGLLTGGGLGTVSAYDIELHNYTHEDGDDGRSRTIYAVGEQSGGEISNLGYIKFSHDGASDDEKGNMYIGINDGDDGTNPTYRIRLRSTGQIMANYYGTAAYPTYSFADNSTGIYYPTAGSIGISTDGTKRLEIDNSGKHTITGSLTTSTSNTELTKIDTVKTAGGVVRWFKITAGGSTFWCPADTSIVK